MKLFQFLSRHIEKIPTKYKKTYEQMDKMLPFPNEAILSTEIYRKHQYLSKKSKSVM